MLHLGNAICLLMSNDMYVRPVVTVIHQLGLWN